MPNDPRKLRPAELLRLLNSTPLGTVLNEPTLRKQRLAAGLRIGDGKHVDLVRYIAWLAGQRHAPPIPHSAPRIPQSYESIKEASRQRNVSLSRSGRDIGPIAKPKHPKRKKQCERDLRLFCETYQKSIYFLDWSEDHLKAINKLQAAALLGGLFALAMPRGSGKSALCESTAQWATLYGHCRFVSIIPATMEIAEDMLASIKSELSNNEKLAEDFPEVCQPIQRLEGISNRCAGQLCDGKPTGIEWTARQIVLPTIDKSPASGAIIRACGLTGAIRGMRFKRHDGSIVRPDLAIPDDPQTDESAASPVQCDRREKLITGTVLGLAGPGKKIACVMPCTVIREGDVADRLLNRKLHPEWQGERAKLVYQWPSNQDLWDQYTEIRADSFRAGNRGEEATAFYGAHRAEMDAGFTVGWPARFEKDELSAQQHAINLRIKHGDQFDAEFQNDPKRPADQQALLSAQEICERLNRHARGVAPAAATIVTCHIDVQARLLYWLVCAWQPDFTGHVLAYGTWPDQARRYFSYSQIRRTLSSVTKIGSLTGSISAGLEALCDELIGREWPRDDGVALRMNRVLIDANWGDSTETIYSFCRGSRHAAVLLPAHGKFVGAGSIPLNVRKRKPGETMGPEWRVARSERAIRHVVYDTNYYKSFCHQRLAQPDGEPGALRLYGDNPDEHRLLADHFLAEYPIRTEGRGRVVFEWKLRPERPDNHWLDNLVGAAVAASEQGAVLPGMGAPAIARAPRKTKIYGRRPDGQSFFGRR